MRCSSVRITRIAWARGGTSSSTSFSIARQYTRLLPTVIQVIQAVGHHLGFVIGLGFHVLLDAGVQEANIGDAVDDLFAIQLQQQAQHAVGAGVLRTHIQQHRLALKRPVGDQVLELIQR